MAPKSQNNYVMLFNGVVWIFVDGFVWICMLFFDFCGCVLLLLFNGFFFNEYMLMIFRSFLVGPPHLLFEFEILAQNHVRFLSSHFVGESSFNISLLCCSDTSRSQCVYLHVHRRHFLIGLPGLPQILIFT